MDDILRFIIIIIGAMVLGALGLNERGTDWLRSRGMPERIIIIIAYFFFMVWVEAPWILVVLTTCAVAYVALTTKVEK